MIGRVLANRYRIVERIGGGGMSLVYRAEDLQLGRDVAVKVLRGQFGTDEEFVRRFRREAHSAASLSHPNVVQIFDVGQEEDQYFIVMELVEGKTLKELIQEQGPLPIAEAARIAIEILGALAHAHQHRIVHRDVKPHNILIGRDGHAKVTDFGIARATTTDTVTHTGSILGSAHYFSPEQANGQPTGEKADIYSLGVVMYEMVTGVVPFQGESPITVALKHLRDKPAPPSQRNSELPVELEEIIMRALEKEAQDRFPSAEAMRMALLQFVADHAAGRTHVVAGDFPTQELRGLRRSVARRLVEEDDEEEFPAEPERPRRRSLAWLWISIVALIVVGGIGGGVWALIGYLDVPEVDVPNVVGLPLAQATQELGLAKLQVEFAAQQRFSNEVPLNHVLETQPVGGRRVKQGSTVRLVLSAGPDERKVPDVRNKTLDVARAALESELFVVGEVTEEYSRTVPEGVVIDQSPQPLMSVKARSEVNLRVSLGPLKVPQIYGKTLDEAKRTLVNAGLVVVKVDTQVDPTKPKDTVLSSEPAQGQPVTLGQTISLVVSTPEGAVPPGGKDYTKEVTVPGTLGFYYDFKVVQVEVVGGVPTETVKFAGKRVAGEKITITGSFTGEAYLRILVDGQEKQIIELR